MELHFSYFFGWLSDKVGRKYIMMGGMLLLSCTDQFTNKCLKRQCEKNEMVANTNSC
jgi:hypothetical protein